MTGRRYLTLGSIVLVLVVGLVLSGALTGCGDSTGRRQVTGPAASTFDSSVPPLNPDQKACPVCDNPIKEGVYLEVEDEGQTKRIYFDNEDCKKQFEQQKDTMLMRFKAKMKAGVE